jgi:hypothetical protein
MRSHEPGAPWKCRAVEIAENQAQVSQAFPTALGNRNCDSHIPTAPTVCLFSFRTEPKNHPKGAQFRGPRLFSPSGSFTD